MFESTLTIPTGSLIGVALLSFFVGVIAGRSFRFMNAARRQSSIGRADARAAAKAAAQSKQDVRQNVVVATGDQYYAERERRIENGQVVLDDEHVVINQVGPGQYDALPYGDDFDVVDSRTRRRMDAWAQNGDR